MQVPGSDAVAGGVAQIKEVTAALVRIAKLRSLPVLLVGHVTKDGNVAGPRTLEHLVDVVLSFEGDRHNGIRMLRAIKNRFGPADEVGCFEMVESGIREVTDPTGLFTSQHTEPAPGTCLSITLAGRRPLLTEVQALVAPSSAPVPRRVTHGVEGGRVAMILAVLQRRAGVRLHTRDVYVSTVGGAKVSDPATDLATAIAVASAAYDQALGQPVIALGEFRLGTAPVPESIGAWPKSPGWASSCPCADGFLQQGPRAEGRGWQRRRSLGCFSCASNERGTRPVRAWNRWTAL